MSGETEYRVDFAASAAKEFRSLPPDVRKRAIPRIDTLANTPHPRGSVKLKGHQRIYRIRVGEYRIVYEVDDPAKRVLVTRIRHRREVYD